MHDAFRRAQHHARLRRPVPEQRAEHRGRPDEPAAPDLELERLRVVLRPVLHDLQRRSDVVDREHVGRGLEPHRQRSRHGVRRQAPRGSALVAELHVQRRGRDLRRRRGRLALARRRALVAEAGRRLQRPGLRLRSHSGLQRQGVDHHRQQPELEVLRAHLRDLDARSSPTTASTRRPRSGSRTATAAATPGRRRRRSRDRIPRSASSRRTGLPASATRISSRIRPSHPTARSTSPSRTARTRPSGSPERSTTTST